MMQDLYQQMILEHNRKPRNFGKCENPSHQGEGFNPLCGDHFWVSLRLDNQGKIESLFFDGTGCAISKASASIMTQILHGKNKEEVKQILEAFQKLLKGPCSPEEETLLGKLTVFSGIWKYPARVKCAILAWHAVNGSLNDAKLVSTES